MPSCFQTKEEAQSLLRDYFELLIKTYHAIVGFPFIMYKDKTTDIS